jgi:hypothetical protein
MSQADPTPLPPGHVRLAITLTLPAVPQALAQVLQGLQTLVRWQPGATMQVIREEGPEAGEGGAP